MPFSTLFLVKYSPEFLQTTRLLLCQIQNNPIQRNLEEFFMTRVDEQKERSLCVQCIPFVNCEVEKSSVSLLLLLPPPYYNVIALHIPYLRYNPLRFWKCMSHINGVTFSSSDLRSRLDHLELDRSLCEIMHRRCWLHTLGSREWDYGYVWRQINFIQWKFPTNSACCT